MSQSILTKKQALLEHLRSELAEGRYESGSRLPSEAELCRLHGVSRTTVRFALARLHEEGYLASSQGSRPVVQAQKLGGQPTTSVGDLVFVLGSARVHNPVTQRLLWTVAHLLPANAKLRVTYTDVPAKERLGIGARDVVVIDGPFVVRGFPSLAPPERTVVLFQQSSVGGFLSTDNRLGGRMIGEHLVDHGHLEVGILHYGAHEQEFARRLAACRTALHKGGANIEEVPLNLHAHTEFTVKQAIELLFRRRPEITAIICLTDRLAIEAYTILAESGRRVPEDISIIGFDGLHTAAWMVPPLTTIRHAYEDMARLLIQTLSDPVAKVRSLVRPILVPGASVADLSTRHPRKK